MPFSTPYKLGRLAASKARKIKWVWSSLTGDSTESLRAEYGVGFEMAAVIRERTGKSVDPSLDQLITKLTSRLSDVVRNKLHHFEANVVCEQSPSAYALPGGFIFITQSLTELCKRDQDEMAFVIAHEMAHVIRRHAINRVMRQTAYSAASVMTPGTGAVGPWLRKVGMHWLERAYSRDQEYEADALGWLLVKSAGFDPDGAIRLLARFLALEPTNGSLSLGEYLSTHPPVKSRIASLKNHLKRD